MATIQLPVRWHSGYGPDNPDGTSIMWWAGCTARSAEFVQACSALTEAQP